MPEMVVDKPNLTKEEQKVMDRLIGAGISAHDITKFGLVNFAMFHIFSKEELSLFCKYKIGGVPESDFGDLRKDRLALRYGFSVEEAIVLSKTKAELNGRTDFKDNPVTIGEIVQRMENLGGRDRDAAGWSDVDYEDRENPEFMRNRAIYRELNKNETNGQEFIDGPTIGKIWQLPSDFAQQIEEEGYVKRYLTYSEEKRLADLEKAGIKKNEQEFYLNLGKELDIPRKYYIRLCAYFAAGVAKGDLKEFMKNEGMFEDGIAVKYDLSPEDALALSKTKAELNSRTDYDPRHPEAISFQKKPVTIVEIIQALKDLDSPEGSEIRKGGLIGGNGTPEQKRVCSIDFVFTQEHDNKEKLKREKVRERILAVARGQPISKTEWASEQP